MHHFTDVATNGKSPVDFALEQDDEVLQITIGESGTVPRQSTGIFKISNQHADYSPDRKQGNCADGFFTAQAHTVVVRQNASELGGRGAGIADLLFLLAILAVCSIFDL